MLSTKVLTSILHKSLLSVTRQPSTIDSRLESTFGLEPDVGVKREFLRRVVGMRGGFGVDSHDRAGNLREDGASTRAVTRRGWGGRESSTWPNRISQKVG